MLYENNDINKVLSLFKSKDETNVQLAKTLVMANQADFYEFWTDLSELFDQPYPKYDQHRLGLLGHFFMKEELEFLEESMPNSKLAYHLPNILKVRVLGRVEEEVYTNLKSLSLRILQLDQANESWRQLFETACPLTADLEQLEISNSEVELLPDFKHLNKLRTLSVKHCTKLKFWEKKRGVMSQLRSLRMNHNGLEKVELDFHIHWNETGTSFCDVNLDFNQLKGLSVSRLESDLSAIHNQLEYVGIHKSDIPNLNLEHNQLKQIHFINYFQLGDLNLNANSIENLDWLSSSYRLKEGNVETIKLKNNAFDLNIYKRFLCVFDLLEGEYQIEWDFPELKWDMAWTENLDLERLANGSLMEMKAVLKAGEELGLDWSIFWLFALGLIPYLDVNKSELYDDELHLRGLKKSRIISKPKLLKVILAQRHLCSRGGPYLWIEEFMDEESGAIVPIQRFDLDSVNIYNPSWLLFSNLESIDGFWLWTKSEKKLNLPPIRRLGLYGDFEDWTFLNDIPSLRKLELFIYQEEWMNIDIDMLRKKFPWIKEIVVHEFYYT